MSRDRDRRVDPVVAALAAGDDLAPGDGPAAIGYELTTPPRSAPPAGSDPEVDGDGTSAGCSSSERSMGGDVVQPATIEAEGLSRATMRHAVVLSDAFTVAVVTHHQALARFAFALCGDVAHAEDVVAEAYARVWPQWRRGRVDDLLPYLRRTVVNEVYGRHRRRLLERREAARPPDRHADDRFETQVDERDALWAALTRLAPQQRVVVVLRIVEDLSEEQTAAMLGVPIGTVKSRLSRALGVLRTTLEDDRG